MAHSVRVLPIAAMIIALPSVGVLVAGEALGLASAVSAGLALAVLIATTGALHEDGLADTADGLFGGATPERRLAIMRDSRIGTYGALALALSVFIRGTALAALTDASVWLASAVLLAGAAVSRSAGLMPLVLLPAARTDGLGAGVTFSDRPSLAFAALLATLSLVFPVIASASPLHTLLAGFAALAAAYVVVPLAQAKIGGQTGDIAGASQQLSEIAFLAVLSGAAR